MAILCKNFALTIHPRYSKKFLWGQFWAKKNLVILYKVQVDTSVQKKLVNKIIKLYRSLKSKTPYTGIDLVQWNLSSSKSQGPAQKFELKSELSKFELVRYDCISLIIKLQCHNVHSTVMYIRRNYTHESHLTPPDRFIIKPEADKIMSPVKCTNR